MSVEAATHVTRALDPFYPIVDNADWVARVIGAGARLVQLRMKDNDEATVRADIARARDICAKANAVLVVNDFWQAAIDLRCDWVHLGQGDLDTADVPALRRAGLRIGLSTHDHAELDRALAFDPDYVALGPVYPTLLKQMPWAPQGLARVSEWKRLIGARPLVAIGGLTLDRIAAVLAAGADCVAVVTDIVRAADPEAQTRAWVAATR
jgi:thiamine-phosphate pyrophosphorylase